MSMGNEVNRHNFLQESQPCYWRSSLSHVTAIGVFNQHTFCSDKQNDLCGKLTAPYIASAETKWYTVDYMILCTGMTIYAYNTYNCKDITGTANVRGHSSRQYGQLNRDIFYEITSGILKNGAWFRKHALYSLVCSTSLKKMKNILFLALRSLMACHSYISLIFGADTERAMGIFGVCSVRDKEGPCV